MAEDVFPFTLHQFEIMIKELKHPRTIYLSERDFERLMGKVNRIMSVAHDKDGTYVTLITTRIRPKIHVVDLSESQIFGQP